MQKNRQQLKSISALKFKASASSSLPGLVPSPPPSKPTSQLGREISLTAQVWEPSWRRQHLSGLWPGRGGKGTDEDRRSHPGIGQGHTPEGSADTLSREAGKRESLGKAEWHGSDFSPPKTHPVLQVPTSLSAALIRCLSKSVSRLESPGKAADFNMQIVSRGPENKEQSPRGLPPPEARDPSPSSALTTRRPYGRPYGDPTTSIP